MTIKKDTKKKDNTALEINLDQIDLIFEEKNSK